VCALRDLFGNALLFVVVFQSGGKDVFCAGPPIPRPHINKHAVGVFVFVVVVVWGAERKGREQVFPKNRERRRSSSKKKSKSRESEKKQKKRTIKLRCFCLCPSLAPSLLIMSEEEVLSSAFFFLREMFFCVLLDRTNEGSCNKNNPKRHFYCVFLSTHIHHGYQ
jgi:hypothetical protein